MDPSIRVVPADGNPQILLAALHAIPRRLHTALPLLHLPSSSFRPQTVKSAGHKGIKTGSSACNTHSASDSNDTARDARGDIQAGRYARLERVDVDSE